MSKTPLAWQNLLYDKTRTVVALAGVSFAVILVLMQLGFFMSVKRTATRLYDQLAFDVMIRSPNYNFILKPGDMPRARLWQVEALPEVEAATPLYVAFNMYRNPITRARRGLLVIGIDPSEKTFRLPAVSEQRAKLQQPDKVLIDTLSRREFGPLEAGVVTDLGSRQIEVVGVFEMGGGFGSDATVITSDQTFISLYPGMSLNQVSLGLVHLKPGADPHRVAEQIRAMLPPDVEVFTRAEAVAGEEHHWVSRTSVGTIFGLGVFVSLLVGVAIVYQVLASDIAKHLPEYATLKAMGYSQQYLNSVVLKQALILAVVGFVPGALASSLLYEFTQKKASIPMDMTAGLLAAVLVLSVAMCAVSAMVSLRKLAKVDPADLF